MFNGINICATGCAAGVTYGAVGTTPVASCRPQPFRCDPVRRSSANLANGNYSAIAASLNTLNYVKTATANHNASGHSSHGSRRGPAVQRVPGELHRDQPAVQQRQLSSRTWRAATTIRCRRKSRCGRLTVSAVRSTTPGARTSDSARRSRTRSTGVRDYSIVNNNHPHVLRTNGTWNFRSARASCFWGTVRACWPESSSGGKWASSTLSLPATGPASRRTTRCMPTAFRMS